MAGLVKPFAFIGAGEPAEGLLLDKVATSAAIAVSLRRLRVGYTGNCMTISNLDNSQELDVGFVNDYLDTASIASFASSYGDAYVVGLYDQSGNGVNFAAGIVDPLLPYAPLICSASGDFYEVDGIKTIANYRSRLGFDDGNSGWTGTSDTHTLFYTTTKANTEGGASAGNKYLMTGTGTSDAPAIISNYNNGGTQAFEQFYNGNEGDSKERNILQTTADSNLHLLTIRRESGGTQFTKGYFDGTEEYQDDSIASSLLGDFKTLGSFSGDPVNRTSHNIGEFILFNAYLSEEDLETVHTDTKTYYNIT